MPKILNDEETVALFDAVLAAKFPDLCSKPKPAKDSLEKIAADHPWLFSEMKPTG